jgi:site-specific recombinase XerD
MKKNNSENSFMPLLGRFFTEYLPVSINASSNTIASYKCAFRLLFQFIDKQTEITISQITFDALNFELLTQFFDWLISNRKNSRATAKQRLAALASFADYSEGRNLEASYIFKVGSTEKPATALKRNKKRKNAQAIEPACGWRS